MSRLATVTKLKPSTASNKFAFTDAALVALKPRANRFEVYDTVQPGLELRVTPQGTKTFRRRKSGEGVTALGRFITGAETPRSPDEALEAIEMSVEEARRQCRIQAGKYADGVNVAAEHREVKKKEGLRSVPLGDLLELYMERQTYVDQPLRDPTKEDYRSAFWHFFGGDKGLERTYSDLTPSLILDLHIANSRKRRAVCRDGRTRLVGSRFQSDKVLHVLAAMTELLKLGPSLADVAYEERGVAEIQSKASRVDPTDLPTCAEWLHKYVKRHKDDNKGLVAQQYIVALSTGLRMSTINRLTWEMLKDVPKMPGRVYLDTPKEIHKNKRPYLIPLAPRAAASLLARRERLIAAGVKPSGLVFPRIKSKRPVRDCATIAADIMGDLGADANFGMHDLRKAINTVHGLYVRTPDFVRRLLMTRVAQDTEEEHYMNATVGRKVATLAAFADEAEEWAYHGTPSDRKLAEFRRAAAEASKILSNR